MNRGKGQLSRTGYHARATAGRRAFVMPAFGPNQLGRRVQLVRRNRVCDGSALGGGYSVFSIMGWSAINRYPVVDSLR